MNAPRIDYSQPELILEFPVHRVENNSDSQKNLDAKRDHFSRKCGEVYRRLMAGERLTVLGAANSGISSLPRRVLDLKKQGVHISDEWREGVKEYFCSSEDLGFNRWTFRAQAAA